MRLLDETNERWQKTLQYGDDLTALRAAVNQSSEPNPCLQGLRSVCWKIFLFFQSLDRPTWKKRLQDSRSAYDSLKEHYTRHLSHPNDLTDDDPSSEGEPSGKSPWINLQQDEGLRIEIFQDIERCMPENAYFREPSTQGKLLDVLFVYCKLNQDVGYRQGMHEVLAPLLWAVYCDAIDYTAETPADTDHLMTMCLDAAYVEHDAFTLFSMVMQTVKSFYEIGMNNERPIAGIQSTSPIVERSKRIHENLLHSADPELAEHLTAIEVLPQIFLIRWIRLIFGREFGFEDVLRLWDVLFAEDPALELVDLIAVSMLLRIRWQLLDEDYTGALTLLLRYPAPTAPYGPSTFLSDAIYLRDNLHLDGGDHIITKYSNRSPETTVSRKLPRRIKRSRTVEQQGTQQAVSSGISPKRMLREHVGIDSVIHDAAKRLYDTGERWGVAKALNSAVQGLQATGTPSRASGDTQVLLRRAESLEQRNLVLSKMLARAVDELWTALGDQTKSQNEAAENSNPISLAIAKVQFVQVYLENASMTLPSEMGTENKGQEASPKKPRSSESKTDDAVATAAATVDGHIDEKPLSVRTKPKARRSPVKEAQKTVSSDEPPATPPTRYTHRVRPSLSQSPYSWMLGEEQPKSGFVSTSLPGATKAPSQRSPQLFGKDSPAGDEDDIFTSRRRM